jgi:SAM-dependent methyltransferase
MKSIARSILSKINIGIADRQNFAIYNLTLSEKVFGVAIPLTRFIVVSHPTANQLFGILHKKYSSDELPPEEQLPNSPILNWDPNRDHSNILSSAQDYRAEISKHQYMGYFRSKLCGNLVVSNGRVYWRLETMRQIRKSIPNIFKGKTLEIGAGTGIVSSTLSKFDEIDEIYCLDYDPYTIKNLMPLVQWSQNANSNKIKRVIGSYNKLECGDNEFDTIVAVGALHHSEDLNITLKECFRVLRPGGIFIISDYVLTGSLSQDEYSMLMGKPIFEKDAKFVLNGGDIKDVTTNESISEHARPKFSYQSAAFNAGFNVTTHFFDATKDTGGALARLFRRACETFKTTSFFVNPKNAREHGYDDYGNVRAFSLSENVRYPAYAYGAPTLLRLAMLGDYASNHITYDNMILILEKPTGINKTIPFRYNNGDVYNFSTHPAEPSISL